MVEKEIKSEPSLPPDYVSLAQLQERWLQKQQVEEEKKQSEKNERGVKITTELPPDYVSLAQLQERWLQKQQEKKVKEKELEEKKQSEQNENRNQKATTNGHEKLEGGSIRDVTRGRIYGREMGAIEEKGKGKEIMINGFGNGEKNDFEGGVSVSMVEVLPRNVKGMGHRGGLRRNGDNRGSVYKGKRENVVKQHHTEVSLDLEKEIEGGKGYDDKLTEKSVNESNKMELKLDGVKRRDGNGLLRQRNNSRNWRYGKFENGRKTEQRDGTSNGMVWVKKEEK